jgi:hypothetical protein
MPLNARDLSPDHTTAESERTVLSGIILLGRRRSKKRVKKEKIRALLRLGRRLVCSLERKASWLLAMLAVKPDGTEDTNFT